MEKSVCTFPLRLARVTETQASDEESLQSVSTVY